MCTLFLRSAFSTLVFGVLALAGMAGDANRALTPEEVAERIKEMKAVAPKDWTKIPWVASLPEARRISGLEQRPIFLFTFEGNLACGRC